YHALRDLAYCCLIMSIFRAAPPPPPSVSTDELLAAIRRRRRRMRLLAIGFTLPVIGAVLSLYIPGWLAADKRRPVPLPAAEREKAHASLDHSKRSLDVHEAAFRAF